MTLYFWRCFSCGWQTVCKQGRVERPSDHWAKRMDGDTRICRGPFQEFEARSL